MITKAELNTTMDLLRAKLNEGADVTSREIQSATDQMEAALALWQDEEAAIANTRHGLDERQAANNGTLRASLNAIIISLTTVRLAMGAAPQPKPEQQDDPGETDNVRDMKAHAARVVGVSEAA